MLSPVRRLRKARDGTLKGISVYFDPRRSGMVLGSFEIACGELPGGGLLSHPDLVSNRHLITRYVNLGSIDENMAVVDELTSGLPSLGETQSINYVIQASLEQGQENLPGNAFPALGFFKKVPELLFRKAIHDPELLLFNQAFPVVTDLSAKVRAVLARWIGSSFKGLVGREDRHPEAPVDSRRWACIS